ncbi:hypothetical protein Ais01nite_77560 [Asanoa ishikariensis]|uniref:WXG100 family type VII secretion target n=1 Tax=Asanoa ishikariensis TaxID=137265 RepID=A0A1H3KSM0_9ACTN|nr:hypothetical protein [Asanoa ishikariensis]GIF69721.1 hypothetical protein Ais01nite_77560 [Asanoa ishikariensis]SDY55080.1 hypothetical protein SAMN05421684_0313 [Asanoa ishikariensis]
MGDAGSYSGMSHRALYDQLFAGNPCVIENTVAAWKSAERQADTLASTIDRDLDGVLAGWEGAAGTEFRDRVGKISTYSRQLSGNFLATHSGLSQMSAALSDAQRKAETPEEHDDNDKMLSGAANGAAKGALFGPAGAGVGALVGGFMGHNQDEEEKERARERMAALVAGVATQYEVADQGDWRPFTPPPTGLPEGDPHQGSGPSGGPRVGAPSMDPGTGPGGSGRTGTVDTPGHVANDPGPAGGPATPGTGTVGTGTQTNGSQLTSGGDGALAAGAATIGTVGALTQLGGTPSPSVPAGTGLSSGGLPPGGVLGSPGTASGSPTSAASATGKGANTVKPASGSGQAATGQRGAASRTSGLNGSQSQAGRPGGGGNSAAGPRNGSAAAGRSQAAGAGRTNQNDEEETDEHSTWLTEDDLIWRDAGDVPPPVLGGA